jgi:hypothetical protein
MIGSTVNVIERDLVHPHVAFHTYGNPHFSALVNLMTLESLLQEDSHDHHHESRRDN